MHELSIAEGIIEIVERTANANHVRHVKTVRVSIGELAGVDIPSLELPGSQCVRAASLKTPNLKLNGRGAKLGAFNAKKHSASPLRRSLPRLRRLSACRDGRNGNARDRHS